jgi:putative ABC transport system ATP-binding protein
VSEILRAERIGKSFGASGKRELVLNDVGFSLYRGQLSALLGPSGSGKTTLLLCLALVLSADAGTLTLNGRRVLHQGRLLVDPLEFRRSNIGFVFQGGNLVPFLTVAENVALMLEIAGQPGRFARKEAAHLLEQLDLGHRARAYPETLSGGERQRVAIARAVATRPALLLADEPTAAIDTERGLRVMELFRRAADDYGCSVLVVTHDERMIGGFDAVLHMTDGRLNGAHCDA